MKTKEIIIYDNYYSSDREKEIREFIFEEYAEENSYQSPEDIPDEYVFDEMDYQDREQWLDVTDKLQSLFDKNVYLLTGTCGKWYGKCDGGEFIRSLNDLLRCIDHLDYIRIYDKNGHLYIHGSHHDGNDDYELKRLTHKGYLLADSYYFARDKDLHQTIMNNNFYSALPHFAKRIYGV